VSSITFRGVPLRETFRTHADEAPWWTRLRCEFVVRVTHTNNQPLAGVLVEIIGGHEVGRRAATDRLGSSSVPGLGRGLVTVQRNEGRIHGLDRVVNLMRE